MPHRNWLLPAFLLPIVLFTPSASADRSSSSELLRRAAARVEATVIAPAANRAAPLFAFSRTRLLRPELVARFGGHPQEDAAGRAFVPFTLHQQGDRDSPPQDEATSPTLGWGCYYPDADEVFIGHPEVGFVVAAPDASPADLAATDRGRCRGDE